MQSPRFPKAPNTHPNEYPLPTLESNPTPAAASGSGSSDETERCSEDSRVDESMDADLSLRGRRSFRTLIVLLTLRARCTPAF